MSSLHLRILTPRKVVMEEDIKSITLPSVDGEITILPKHVRLFSLLKEGIVRFSNGDEKYLAIGGGYVETDGKDVHVLVSRAYGQDEIDQRETERALDEAKKIIAETKDVSKRKEAEAILRRSVIDMKLIRRRKSRVQP